MLCRSLGPPLHPASPARARRPEGLRRRYGALIEAKGQDLHRPIEGATQLRVFVARIGQSVRHDDALAIPVQDRRDRRADAPPLRPKGQAEVDRRSEEHTSELQSLMRISYAVFCVQNKK